LIYFLTKIDERFLRSQSKNNHDTRNSHLYTLLLRFIILKRILYFINFFPHTDEDVSLVAL